MIFDEKFWLMVSFAIFLAAFLQFAMPFILKAIDHKSFAIASEIDEARKLKNEAKRLLEEAEKIKDETVKYCSDLIDNTEKQSNKIIDDARKYVNEEVTRRTSTALDNIGIMEENAQKKVKAQVVDMAIDIVREEIKNNANSKVQAGVLENSIGDVKKILQ